MALDDFLRAEVWRPLGMTDTGFAPDPTLWDRVATTELDQDYRGFHVHGVVHDENAYAIGGVAGHAGLFSSARDLAVFTQMMLDRGVAGPCRADAASGLPCHRPRFAPVSIFAQGWVDRITRRTVRRVLARPSAGTPPRSARRPATTSRPGPSATPATPARRSGSIPRSSWRLSSSPTG